MEFTVGKKFKYNRKRASGARHTKCVRHIGYSSKAASGNVVKYLGVHASQRTQSVKSSRYNRKRASRARHMNVCVALGAAWGGEVF